MLQTCDFDLQSNRDASSVSGARRPDFVLCTKSISSYYSFFFSTQVFSAMVSRRDMVQTSFDAEFSWDERNSLYFWAFWTQSPKMNVLWFSFLVPSALNVQDFEFKLDTRRLRNILNKSVIDFFYLSVTVLPLGGLNFRYFKKRLSRLSEVVQTRVKCELVAFFTKMAFRLKY